MNKKETMENKKGSGVTWFIGIIAIVVLILIISAIFFIFVMTNSELRKEVCGTHTETYTTSTIGCDKITNCRCLHNSWAGLGSCNSCECSKEVSNC